MKSIWRWAGAFSGVAAGLLGAQLAFSAATVRTVLAAEGKDEGVVLAYDHSPGTKLVYQFTSEDVVVHELPTGTVSSESGVRATVEYEVLAAEKEGRHRVRCEVLSVDVTADGPTAEAFRAAAAAAAKLPCEGALGATGIAAKLVADDAEAGATKAAATKLNRFIGVGALGWARLPGSAPVRPGDRWGPGTEKTRGGGARFIYTLRGIEHIDGARVATIDFANDVDRPRGRSRAEGRYTFDLDAGRWLSTSGWSELENESSSGSSTTRITHKIEASLVR